jgi:hypothetical protein
MENVANAISNSAGLYQADLFRFLRELWDFCGPASEGASLHSRRAPFVTRHRDRDLLRSGLGVYLVLEEGPLPAAVRGHGVPAKELRPTGTDGHRCTADAVQSTRLGRDRRTRRQRQAIYPGNLRGTRKVLAGL